LGRNKKKDGLPKCDAVVNFAGKHILSLTRRWNSEYEKEVISSRVETTTILVDSINNSKNPPKVFISTAGKCIYGTDPNKKQVEGDKTNSVDMPSLLSEVWEASARRVDTSKVRHVQMRIGIVLGDVQGKGLPIALNRGILPIIRAPFCLSMGGYLGSGKQFFPWIHIDDVVGIYRKALQDPTMDGIYNCVAPNIVTNEEFTNVFAKKLRRRILWHIPSWLIKLVVGKARSGILLEGQHVHPKRTLESGYKFQYPTINVALDNLVKIYF